MNLMGLNLKRRPETLLKESQSKKASILICMESIKDRLLSLLVKVRLLTHESKFFFNKTYLFNLYKNKAMEVLLYCLRNLYLNSVINFKTRDSKSIAYLCRVLVIKSKHVI